MNKILVIAPHPDDETLGCGGMLLRSKYNGDELHWLIITGINKEDGWPDDLIHQRENEINEVSLKYGFESVHNYSLATTRLDVLPTKSLIDKIGGTIKEINPNIIYLPHFQDAHSDHQITAKAVHSCLKWFRYPSIERALVYETISETDFSFYHEPFKPNYYCDISNYIDEKVSIMNLYKSEIDKFPFPRCEKTIRSLAYLRGSQSGFIAAESFEIILERN